MPTKLGPLSVGGGSPVRIMAAVNVSPESFYKGSVASTPQEILGLVRRAIEEGADVVDVGAMSTAPYLRNEISERAELTRIERALTAISETQVLISVDTVRARVANAALKSGASMINDVSGLKNDPEMAGVVSDHGASLLAMAHSSTTSETKPINQVRRALKETLKIAEKAEIPKRGIVLDPGIGFFREEGAGRAYSPQTLMPWYEWDCRVMEDLGELESLGRPLCVGLSRKSFLGKILNLENPEERLPASLAATAIAVMNGASVIRTHDVKETVQAVRVVAAIMKKRGLRAHLVS